MTTIGTNEVGTEVFVEFEEVVLLTVELEDIGFVVVLTVVVLTVVLTIVVVLVALVRLAVL